MSDNIVELGLPNSDITFEQAISFLLRQDKKPKIGFIVFEEEDDIYPQAVSFGSTEAKDAVFFAEWLKRQVFE